MERNNKFQFVKRDDFDSFLPSKDHALKKRDDKEKILKLFELFADIEFGDKNDLRFALLEYTNNINIDKIGDIVIFSPEENYVDELKSYKSIIKEVNNKFSDNLSSYEDWYDDYSHILIMRNKSAEKFSSQTPKWFIERSDTDMSLGLERDTLSPRLVTNYLEFYADLMHEKFNLKKYPHYCIIVRPISTYDGNKIYPLGNIYLHFGTNEFRNEKFYLKLINDFINLWHRINCSKILKSEPPKVQTISKKLKCYYPSFLGTNIRKITAEKIYAQYDKLFENEDKVLKLEQDLEIISKDMVEKFAIGEMPYIALDMIRENESTSLDDKFCQVLKQREFFKLGLFLFGKTVEELHTYITEQSDSQRTDLKFTRTQYSYFLSGRFLPIDPKNVLMTTQKRIIKSLSNYEKGLINKWRSLLNGYSNLQGNYELLLKDIQLLNN